MLGNCGTIIHPLGIYLKNQGIGCANGNVDVTALNPILERIKNDNVDSNCDGKPDYEELVTCDWGDLQQNQCGVDAPTGDAGSQQPEVAENVIYGCATSPGFGVGGGAAVGISGALAAIAVRRRRRRDVTS